MELKITNGLKHFNHTPEVKSAADKNDEAKIAKAAKDFESLLTSLMLKEMKTNKEGLFGESNFGGDYFDMIFMNEIASKMSQGKGLGIAEMIFKKMTGKSLPEEIEKTSPVNFRIKTHNEGLRSIQPGKNSINRLKKYEPYIEEASEKFGISKNIIRSVILTESAANEKARSHADAKGLMQLLDTTADEMGVRNIWNPRENILGGTKYLSQLLRLYNGNLELALAGYNAGPGSVEKFNGVPPFEETKNYISRVMSYINHLNENENEV